MKQEYKRIGILTWLLLCMFVLMPVKTVDAASTKKITGTNRFDYAYQVLDKVNAERKKEGYSALDMDEDLLKAAMLRAAECSVSFSHTRPNGEICFTISEKMYGENIAYGYTSPTAVMKGWMNSEGHRANILNSGYASVGIGCFKRGGKFYWTQCFGYDTAKSIKQPDNGKATYQIALKSSKSTKFISGAWIDSNPLSSKMTGFKAKAGKRKLTLTWNRKSGIDGYQMEVSNKKSFANADTYIIGKGKTKKIITKYGGKKLKSKKRYYVRIRPYVKTEVKSNGDVYTEKTGYTNTYGKWKVVNKKTK